MECKKKMVWLIVSMTYHLPRGQPTRVRDRSSLHVSLPLSPARDEYICHPVLLEVLLKRAWPTVATGEGFPNLDVKVKKCMLYMANFFLRVIKTHSFSCVKIVGQHCYCSIVYFVCHIVSDKD